MYMCFYNSGATQGILLPVDVHKGNTSHDYVTRVNQESNRDSSQAPQLLGFFEAHRRTHRRLDPSTLLVKSTSKKQGPGRHRLETPRRWWGPVAKAAFPKMP